MPETLGASLRAAREARQIPLEDVERLTRIRSKFLLALEADDYAALPTPAQARGFLRNYAEFLELDVEQVLAIYDGGRHRKPRPHPAPVPPPPSKVLPPRPAPVASMGRAPQVRSRRLRWLSPDLFFALAVTAALLLLLGWAFSQLRPLTAIPTATLPPRLVAGLARSPSPTTTPGVSTATPTPEIPTPAVEYSGVNLSVRAELSTWVSVRVDGIEQFAGLLSAGTVRDFVGQSSVEVATGNGLATRIIVNGRDQGVMGELGEAVIDIWTLSGMLTPTPTALPTATP